MTADQPHAAHDDHGGDHGHGHGSRFIQHHYDDAQHQFDSGKLGIWLFLAQEVLFFSGLFVAYVLYRHHHPEIYSYAHQWLDVKYGAINTCVLIASSGTAAWAVRCAQLNQRKGLIVCLAATILCACTFLGIKYIEYAHKYHEHILFGRYFDPCVSSGGNELLTKNNECAGSKTTIVWDYGTETPKAGSCFKDIDQDPREEGVQADCVVKENTVEHKVEKVMKDKVDADGKAVMGADGKPAKEEVEEEKEVLVAGREIKDRCVEESPFHEEGEAKVEKKFPCWRTAYQPAVCKKDVGILIEYGDKDEREELRITATCKPTPKPADAGDILADKANPLVLGQHAIHPRHQLTTHEEHELEAAGPPPEHTNMFMSVYFAMTGLHGIHVFVGVIVFIWLLVRAMKGHFTPDYFGPVDYAALYWHIVDLIWIFLFPLLYLIH